MEGSNWGVYFPLGSSILISIIFNINLKFIILLTKNTANSFYPICVFYL